jgi:hypothetical protein
VGQRCFYADLLDHCAPGESISKLIDSWGPGWLLHEQGFEVEPEDCE